MSNILIQFNATIIGRFKSMKFRTDQIPTIILILIAIDEKRMDILDLLQFNSKRMLVLYRILERYGILKPYKLEKDDRALTKTGEELVTFVRKEFEEYVGSPLTSEVLNPTTPEILDWIEEYLELFPSDEYCQIYRLNRKLRSHPKDVNTRMLWFIKVYNYTKDTILSATRAYIEHQENCSDGHLYTRSSNYFIVKGSGSDKVSDLASWCESVLHKDNSAENNPLTDII